MNYPKEIKIKAKGKVTNLWASYEDTFLPVHADAKEQIAEVEIKIDINQIIRNHFSTVFQKDDLMIAIVEAGNNASQEIIEKLSAA